jgi:hypothetical protein
MNKLVKYSILTGNDLRSSSARWVNLEVGDLDYWVCVIENEGRLREREDIDYDSL